MLVRQFVISIITKYKTQVSLSISGYENAKVSIPVSTCRHVTITWQIQMIQNRYHGCYQSIVGNTYLNVIIQIMCAQYIKIIFLHVVFVNTLVLGIGTTLVHHHRSITINDILKLSWAQVAIKGNEYILVCLFYIMEKLKKELKRSVWC